jgi:hypothetical protein
VTRIWHGKTIRLMCAGAPFGDDEDDMVDIQQEGGHIYLAGGDRDPSHHFILENGPITENGERIFVYVCQAHPAR